MLYSNRDAKNARLSFATKVAKETEALDVETLVKQILACRPINIQDGTSYAFKWDYLHTEILSKYCGPGGDPDARVRAAIAKMLGSEISCRDLNEHGFGPLWRFDSVITRATHLIGECLGDIAEDFIPTLKHIAFTSGATVCRRRSKGDPWFKYDQETALSVTTSCLPYAKLIIDSTPLWAGQKIRLCRGNSVFTVPKDCDIDRAACKEPALNQLIQSSVGSFIRSRLKTVFGIDLNDQSRNRTLAREGSLTGSLATIDLKSASDSISCRLVDEMLSPIWSNFLNSIRSKEGQLPDGSWVTWEKHSTMGNGYTFELESLLFYAITRAACETIDLYSRSKRTFDIRHISVYGDDIICPSYYYTYVADALASFGFTVNDKKSFHKGPFRESCGGHYHNGYDVKPFYIRKPIDSPERLIWLLNALRRWAAEDGICDPSIYPLWLRLRRKFVPPCFLGGQNLSSISEVCSPEEPRYSILWITPKKKIDGPRAILRWFQYNPETDNNDTIRIKHTKRLYADYHAPLEEHGIDFNHIMDVGSRSILRVKRYVPTLVDTSIFPQEYRDCRPLYPSTDWALSWDLIPMKLTINDVLKELQNSSR